MDFAFDALFGLIGVIAGAVITSWSQRSKVKADSEKTEADTNEQIRQTVMALIKPLQERVAELERELADWKEWANCLVTQVESLGHEPVPFKAKRKN
jgi:seryl-tRNA synthetase